MPQDFCKSLLDTLDSLMVRAGAMTHLSKCAGCNRTTLDLLAALDGRDDL